MDWLGLAFCLAAVLVLAGLVALSFSFFPRR
jgi:hypothetical protein